jgi:hypothetical protein
VAAWSWIGQPPLGCGWAVSTGLLWKGGLLIVINALGLGIRGRLVRFGAEQQWIDNVLGEQPPCFFVVI